jgi:hypothetical protein
VTNPDRGGPERPRGGREPSPFAIERGDMEDHQVLEAIAQQRCNDKRAGKLLAEACASGDVAAFLEAVDYVNSFTSDGWEHAMRQIARGSVHPSIAAVFLPVWTEHKSIASRVDSVGSLVAALRKLLPPYQGSARRLFRGEGRSTWKRRAYGLSWTEDISTAEKFATDLRQFASGGSLIIEALVPADAIICSFDAIGSHYEEKEFLIDRRKLRGVKIVREFPQLERPAHAR